MASLTRDHLFSAARSAWKRETVDAPELGGSVSIRCLSLSQVLKVTAFQKDNPEGSVRLYALIARESLCNDEGLPLCTADDDAAVEGLPFTLLERIATAAMKLNGMDKGAEEAARKN